MAGKLDAFLKMSKFALGKLPKGGPEKVEALITTVAEDLAAKGVPAAAIERITGLGKSILRKGQGLPKSVQALAGSSENVKIIEESLGMARSAWRGASKGDLKTQYANLLKAMEDSGVSPSVMAGMRKLSPQQVADVGVGQTISAFDRLGPDPFITQMYRKIAGGKSTTKAQAGTLKELLGEGVEKVTPGTAKMMTAAGVPGFTGAAKVKREVAGAVGGFSGTGAAVTVGLPAMFSMYGRESHDPSAARSQAVEGFMSLGGTSSSAVMSEIVKQQEMAARRQMVMQSHDPEMFSKVLNVLSDTGGSPGTLTATEREIGTQTATAAPGRRPDNDVKFLLDQLLNEASGQF